MKKSQLRNIIRESIKKLIVERVGCGPLGYCAENQGCLSYTRQTGDPNNPTEEYGHKCFDLYNVRPNQRPIRRNMGDGITQIITFPTYNKFMDRDNSRRTISEQKKYPVPKEILIALKDKLKMDPLIRFVDKIKALNSIPPAYTIFLLNGKTFDIYYEEFSLLIKIGADEYFINDQDERNYAIKRINDLLTQRKQQGFGDEETPTTPTTPTPTGGGTSPTPPAEEPEEEPEA